MSGPRKDTKIEVVFERIYDDLKAAGKDQELQAEYQQVWQINKLKLQPLLYQWTTKEVEDMVLAAGFSEVTFRSDTEYAGQAMVVGARKFGAFAWLMAAIASIAGFFTVSAMAG